MKQFFFILVASAAIIGTASAQEVTYRSTLYDQSAETRDLLIDLAPVGDEIHFSLALTNTETGFERRHVFVGEGATDPRPFHLANMNYCGTMTILITVEYPWRHDLLQFVRVLDTFAFRASDFEFIDVAFGPLTDIALIDSSVPESKDLNMQPPILVECLPQDSRVPFQFVTNSMRP